MEIKRFFAIALLLLTIGLSFSCKKTTDNSNIANEAVVISYIMAGHPISVKVYEQKALDDTSSYGPLIGGLKLSVTDGSNTDNLVESATGTYTSTDSTFLVAGKTYTLNFTYNNQAVSASTLMPSKPTGYVSSATSLTLPIATTQSSTVALIFSWDNPNSLYHVLVFKNDDTDPGAVHLVTNAPINFTFNVGTVSTYDVYYRSLNYYGTYHAILYSVNKEYIDLLNSATTTTSKNLVNPPTNVNNGLGIFTAMQADTINLTFN